MSEVTRRNKELMRRIYEEMWNKGDPSLAVGIFARPEGVERFMHGFLSAFPDLTHTVEKMIAEGNQVAVRFSAHGTHKDQWMQFERTNRSIHYTGVTLARIAGDKVVEHHTWWDKTSLIEQLEEG